ncbi:hypothetical protein [Burkholderia cenocepacia]|uniref:hypothetical protein n=1 Tax=Burkholderia cenocepacia TaxID=95486 RepID=UPI00264CDB60|nr:hypothetical protein [Burkholderia cenocepacia]MDN7537055.1 hypothetical protein [Burkholderia cenocepacia]
MEHEYAFDVKLFAAIRVKANSVAEARDKLNECVQEADANLGAWPDGSPILCEVSVETDEHHPCFEVDGESDHPDCDA